MDKTHPYPKRFAHQAAFGKWLWGHKKDGAQTRLANITLAELEENDMTCEIASHWLEHYLDCKACGRGGETAPIRVELMEKCLKLLESKGGK